MEGLNQVVFCPYLHVQEIRSKKFSLSLLARYYDQYLPSLEIPMHSQAFKMGELNKWDL